MRSVLVSALVLALAACSPPAGEGGGESAAPEQTSAESGAAAMAAQIRPGRWRQTITAMGVTRTEVECVTTAELNEWANADPSSHCTTEVGFQRTAEGWVYEADCSGEGGGGRIRTVMNGDMQNNYTSDSVITGSGMAEGMNMQMHVEGTYEGACRGDE
jgi:hypothetical protein